MYYSQGRLMHDPTASMPLLHLPTPQTMIMKPACGNRAKFCNKVILRNCSLYRGSSPAVYSYFMTRPILWQLYQMMAILL